MTLISSRKAGRAGPFSAAARAVRAAEWAAASVRRWVMAWAARTVNQSRGSGGWLAGL